MLNDGSPLLYDNEHKPLCYDTTPKLSSQQSQNRLIHLPPLLFSQRKRGGRSLAPLEAFSPLSNGVPTHRHPERSEAESKDLALEYNLPSALAPIFAFCYVFLLFYF